MPAPFSSILFPQGNPFTPIGETAAPECFHDLFLDQVVDAVTRGREQYELDSFFQTPLTDVASITFRQEVFQDLERQPLHDCVTEFATTMRKMRDHLTLSGKLHYVRQKQRWFIAAIADYCEAVTRLADDLTEVPMASAGFTALRGYVTGYARSVPFTTLREQASQLQADLSEVRYSLLNKGNRITVGPYDDEPDYREKVLETFERFQQGAAKDYRIDFPATADMDHVEAGVLDLVANVFPDPFSAVGTFCAQNSGYLDPVLGRFDRELQFYLAYLEYVAPLRRSGLDISYPNVSAAATHVEARESFDLALAAKLTSERSTVVRNDFHLTDPERILVVSGPNQGGKTTLARTFGQLHYLASLGCPAPGTDLHLSLADRIFTHFEREEDFTTLAGKLEDDLHRLHLLLELATPASVIILNEIFNSTTLNDALLLSREVLERVSRLDALCVCVTFLDELSILDEKTVSMVSTIVPDNPALRTYKLVRRPADGRAYALAIAEKYGLTYDSLKGRIIR